MIGALAGSPTFYSRDLLARAGIDVADPAVYHALIDRLERELDRLELALAAPQIP